MTILLSMLGRLHRRLAAVPADHWLRRLYPQRRLGNFILSRVSPRVVEIDGHRMFLDRADSLRLSVDPDYEAGEVAALKLEVRSGDIAVDIGANIGFYTLHLARLVGPHGRVYAFEPDADNFALLTRNIAENGYRNVDARRAAVTDRNGRLSLYVSRENRGDHRTYDPGGGRSTITVECVRLDDALGEDATRVSCIKMDIQGAEAAAVAGMPRILSQSHPMGVFVEFWPEGLRTFGAEPHQFLESLERHGFRIYRIDDDTRRVEPVGVEELLRSERLRHGGHANLLLRKGGGREG